MITKFYSIRQGIALAFLILFAVAVTTVRAASWPASDASGTDIGANLRAAYSAIEPSGIIWNSGQQKYVGVGDDGQVWIMDEDGSNVTLWQVGSSYDLEGVTYVDAATGLVYLLDENTSSAREFNLNSGVLTGRSWSFAAQMSEVGGMGAEGLTWVPDGAHNHGTTASGGLFFVGWQYDGDIFVYEPNLDVNGEVSFIEEIHTTSGYSDISGLNYSSETGLVYAIYDGLNVLEERSSADGSLVASYTLPGNDQEGIALRVDCAAGAAALTIAEDSGRVMSYEGYPITCLSEATEEEPPIETTTDADSDGVASDADCNDTDASVSVPITYYADADGDTLGSDTTSDACQASPPTGYVTNSNDTNDAIPNFGIEITGDSADNDGDGTVDEVNTLSENGAHPYYGSFDPTDTTIRSSAVKNVVGTTNGDIFVTYADDSVFKYDIFSFVLRRNTKFGFLLTTGYLVAFQKHQTAVVNVYNGEVLYSATFPVGPYYPFAWAKKLFGF